MSDTTADRIADALSRIALVLRAQAWEEAGTRGLTVTQGRVLALVADAPRSPRLGDVGRSLGIKAPTASKAVTTLVDKGLLEKRPAEDDGRALALHLTAKGRREASRAARWPEKLAPVVGLLDEDEQAVMLRGLVKMIRELQRQGRIPTARTCVDCRHFRPFAHPGAAMPHHCAFVDAPFGDGGLQVACPDHAEASDAQAADAFRRLLHVVH